MRNAYGKDIFREVTRSFGRFFLLCVIAALGAAFYVGIQSTSIDMNLLGDAFYKERLLFDFHLQSNYGFDDDDVVAVRTAALADSIMPAYSADALYKAEEDSYVLKTLSLSSPLNIVRVEEGRLPEVRDECVVEQKVLRLTGLKLGDTLELTREEDGELEEILYTTRFTIVGVVTSPLYITFERGRSSLGSGSVDAYLYLPEDAYDIDVYTDIYMRMKGSGTLDNMSEDYTNQVDALRVQLEAIAERREIERFQKIQLDAQKALDEQRAELEVSKANRVASLAEGQRALDAALAELTSQQSDMMAAEALLRDAELTFSLEKADALASLDAAEQTLTGQESVLLAQERQLIDGQRQVMEGYQALSEQSLSLDRAERELMPYAQYARFMPEVAQGLEEITDGRKQIEAAERELDAKKTELDTARTQLDAGRAQLSAGQSELREQRIAAETSLASAQAALEEQLAAFEAGQEAWRSGYEAYLASVTSFELEKELSAQSIRDAEIQIDDALVDILEMKEAKWYLNDREDSLGFGSYERDADRIGAIGQVFPLIFFLVAALVGLTSMTRMVDEHRQQVGVFKALGYSGFSILSKYLLYALLASGIGSVLGFLFGAVFFPTLIWDAYSTLYHMREIPTPYDPLLCGLSVLASVGTVLGATLWAVLGELRQQAANLMRPKPPASGKRIFLERIGFIWKHLKFSYKVTSRNLFRYKKRLFMTVLGIAGCTALLMTGFGLRDSIGDIASLQFEELSFYNALVFFDDDEDAGLLQELEDELRDNQHVTDHLYARQENTTVSIGGLKEEATLFVPENARRLKDFLVFRDRKSQNAIPFSDTGVLLTEKIASNLGVKVGDSITLTDDDGLAVSAPVSGIVETYLNHYVYMTPTLYRTLYPESFAPNSAMLISGIQPEREDVLGRRLMELDAVLSVVFTSDSIGSLDDMVKTLDVVVVVLIGSAAALAFIVLLNLTNINITERQRELATIKVLGFYPGELSAYVYRENAVLTFFGMVAGLGLGLYLHSFIITTVEVDMAMFARQVHLASYIYSMLLTAAFAMIVNLIMNFRLRRINMVEALKSVE